MGGVGRGGAFKIVNIYKTGKGLVTEVLGREKCGIIKASLSTGRSYQFTGTLRNCSVRIFCKRAPSRFFRGSSCVIPPTDLSGSSDLFGGVNSGPVFRLCSIVRGVRSRGPMFKVANAGNGAAAAALLGGVTCSGKVGPYRRSLRNVRNGTRFVPVLRSELSKSIKVLRIKAFNIRNAVKEVIEGANVSTNLVAGVAPSRLGSLKDFVSCTGIGDRFVSRVNLNRLVMGKRSPAVVKLLERLSFGNRMVAFNISRLPSSIKVGRYMYNGRVTIGRVVSNYKCCFYGYNLAAPRISCVTAGVSLRGEAFSLRAPARGLAIGVNISKLRGICGLANIVVTTRGFLSLPCSGVLPSVTDFSNMDKEVRRITRVRNGSVFISCTRGPTNMRAILGRFGGLCNSFAAIVAISSRSKCIKSVRVFGDILGFSGFVIPTSITSRGVTVRGLGRGPRLGDEMFLGRISSFRGAKALKTSRSRMGRNLEGTLGLSYRIMITVNRTTAGFGGIIFSLWSCFFCFAFFLDGVAFRVLSLGVLWVSGDGVVVLGI